MEFQADSLKSSEDASAFMPSLFATKLIGVELDPEDWLGRLRAVTPESDLLARKTHKPVFPIGGAIAQYLGQQQEGVPASWPLRRQSCGQPPCSSCRRYSSASKWPCDEAMSPFSPNDHRSKPLMKTRRPVPPGPVLVPESVQWYSVDPASIRTSVATTRRSGNATMKDRATAAMAFRPMARGPSLTRSEPCGE